MIFTRMRVPITRSTHFQMGTRSVPLKLKMNVQELKGNVDVPRSILGPCLLRTSAQHTATFEDPSD